jgi:non-ribosomal peptide synthetase component E (peptide arylation enzyme)
MLNEPDLNDYDLSSLRSLRTAGAALRPEMAELARDAFGKYGTKFGGGEFGSSEGPCAGPRYGGPAPPRGSVGVPKCDGDRWKAVDDDEQNLPPGVEGELVAKGPCVFTGYYKSEAENRSIFTHDGYYKMGDLGKVDEQGNIFITGRKKDIIQRGGEAIVPKQIEDLLHKLPEIEQAVVVGMPDARLGEKACAYVVLKPQATLTFDGMVGALRSMGAGVLLLPERLEIVGAFPKTSVGKPDKSALRKDIAAKLRTAARDFTE